MTRIPTIAVRSASPAGDARQGRPRRPGCAQVLTDKARIPRPSFPVLRRTRVAGLLSQATKHRVTLVCGPAGSGKTIACASWASNGQPRPAGRSGRVAWLTAEPGDQRDWFWAYLRASLSRLRAASAAEAFRDLEDVPAERFPLRLIEAAQQLTEPIVLVIDDVHELTDPAVLSGLDLLVRHAPPTLRLVLSGRRHPPLQLARLRVAGELADIGGADLACTAEEAGAYFAMLGIDVAAGERDELLRRTEGWMAGLRLAAMRASTVNGDGSRITGLAGDEPDVTDYLWDEVLGEQQPDTLAFLLRTSIAAEVSGDLAYALTGEPGSARTLEQLSRANSLV
ncbi:MAG: AAA family ATPase, partial [Nocardiopsaceae bacterium]|nr:AAA family ATPase [Nocardiopsaceae bacterium]